MRLRILLDNERFSRVPINHHDLLAGVMYRLLGAGDADYARFLHDEGYALGGAEAGNETDSPRRFKLFHFSTLRVPRNLREIDGAFLEIRPGRLSWYVASPITDFLQYGVSGLLTAGSEIHVGRTSFRLAGVEALPDPRFTGESVAFTCLTPVVAAVPSPDGRPTPYYLRPADADAFSEAVRKNLLRKYSLIHGKAPGDDRLRLDFDPEYVARARHGGTKKVTIHNTEIIGVQAPLTLAGSPELIQTAWDCGLGEKNSMGFGMLEIILPQDRSQARR